ncbi:hypothetical protein PGTUg99_004185 [Puccinia graminis f. sp. tritici]|uniref:Uncharacterized protein n=1 Tax=Puccinia graminis f. sp. tritici TaxID=56615 RepID=A0A5B0P7J2_PUCGR|nr:hypothetical protein PGTUg99_004185 [Puccinia graminis f. sp. tritici]
MKSKPTVGRAQHPNLAANDLKRVTPAASSESQIDPESSSQPEHRSAYGVHLDDSSP